MSILSLNPAELRSLAVCEVVHSPLCEVEAIVCMVDSQDVDGLAVVCDAIACSALDEVSDACNATFVEWFPYLCRVPALHTLIATNTWEASNITLISPAIFGNQAIGAI